jgi:hypothetical protein
MNITKQMCVGLWEYMRRTYSTTLIDKRTSEDMQLISAFLDMMKITSKEKFLSRFTTTIGHHIFTPFTVGEGNEQQLWRQMVVCVHEHQHVEQMVREGFPRFSSRYLLDSTRRAEYEAEAYRCNLEMHWWRFKVKGGALELARKLKDYGCTDDQIRYAAKFLRLSNEAIENGAVANRASQLAIKWLDEFRPFRAP